MDYSTITIFDIKRKEINYKLLVSFLFNSSNNIDNKYRQVKVDFSN